MPMVEAMIERRIRTKLTIVAGLQLEQLQNGPQPGMKFSEKLVQGNNLGTELTNDSM